MTWRTVGGSVAGSAHRNAGTPCQDAWIIRSLAQAPCGPVVVLVVADGAGSASRGGEGAALAVRAAAAHAEDALATGRWHGEETLRACFTVARAALTAEAITHGAQVSDFACTLLMAVLGRQMTVLAQIGDGAIVVSSHHDETLFVPITPMVCEYANVTRFLTDANAMEMLEVRSFPEPARRAALLTDGLQRLALRWGDEVGHLPFFRPFFDVLQHTGEGQDRHLTEAMETFLGSPAVRERTDDDTTLVCAHWLGAAPDA